MHRGVEQIDTGPEISVFTAQPTHERPVIVVKVELRKAIGGNMCVWHGRSEW